MTFDPAVVFNNFDFATRKHVVVAVSGGSDSVALLLLLQNYLQNLKSRPLLSAVTVDHALREGSAMEAEGVSALCASIGVPHSIKRWEGPKPTASIQATARTERRALLCEAAGETGADVIVTGHTLDDQLETVLMRQRRGSGPGLAGIAPASLAFNDRGDGSPIWIVRPLLATKRQDLRNWLLAQGHGWVDDPSNDNQAYERIAVRNQLREAPVETLHALESISALAAVKRVELSQAAARLLKFYAQEIAPGLIYVVPGIFQAAENEALKVMLRTLIAFVGGAGSVGDAEVVSAMMDRALNVGFGKGVKPWRETSNGALIEMRQGGVYLLRESRKSSRTQIAFDGRYRVTARAGTPINAAVKVALTNVPASLIRHAAKMEPQYDVGDGTVIFAAEAAQLAHPLRRLINPWPDLVPHFDILLAQSLHHMAGCGEFPPSPVHSVGKN